MVRSGGKAMTKMKTIFVIIFLALLIPVLLAAPESEAKVYRGKYANNTKWSYNTKTKTVTIECCGELPDDGNGSAGWRDYYLKAKKVIFKKGITSIGAGAFDNFQKLEEVVLPERLETIKASAFFSCYRLKKINVPKTLRTIASDVFIATKIESFSLRRVKKIGNMCFLDSKIKEVYLSKDCRSSSLVFWGCEKLKKVTLEDGIKKISYGMFCDTALKTIDIPGSVFQIGEDAFADCKKLQKVTLHEGIKKVGKNAFYNTSLKEITIPSTVTKLGKNAFRRESLEKSSLKKVVIRSKNIKKWGTMVFGATRDDLVIYVPQSKKAEYEKILRSTNGLDFHAKIVGKKW